MKKVAIVYFGLLRCLDRVYKSHEKYIFDVFKKNNLEYKIFIHTWKTSDGKQMKGDKYVSESQNYEQNKLIKPYKYTIDNQEDFINNIDFDKYFYKDIWDKIGHHKKGEWRPGLIKNHLCALESQKRVIKMVSSTGIDFDYIMFVRPDVMFQYEFPINTIEHLNNYENGILIPNFAHYEGVNDRFAMMNYNYSKYYANRIDEIADFRKTKGRIVSEKYTKYIVKKYYRLCYIEFKFKMISPG